MPDAPPPDDRRDPPDEAGGPDAQAPRTAAHAGGFTLDLSSGPTAGQPEGWRRKRKQASPLLTKIVDLTAPKPAPPKPAPPKPAPPKPAPKAAPAPEAGAKPQAHARKPPREKKREDGRERGKQPGGATLADLLDEATLARLRGGE